MIILPERSHPQQAAGEAGENPKGFSFHIDGGKKGAARAFAHDPFGRDRAGAATDPDRREWLRDGPCYLLAREMRCAIALGSVPAWVP